MSDKDKGVYAPPPEGYDRFDVSEEDDSKRGPLLLVVAVAVLLAFAAVIFTAYHQGVRSGGRSDAPVITAEKGPLKTKPETSNPKQTASKENAAYDPIDKPDGNEEVVIAQGPEKPVERGNGSRAGNAENDRAQIPEQDQPVLENKPAPAVKRNPVKPAASSAYNIDTSGSFVVQLGAYRSEDQAMKTWGTLSKRLPVIMDGTRADVQRADRGAKGIYYRLRAAAFVDRASALKFCAALKIQGQDCLVAAR